MTTIPPVQCWSCLPLYHIRVLPQMKNFLDQGMESRPALALGADWCGFEAVLDAGCSGTPGSGKWMRCRRAVWERNSVGWTMVGKATRYSWVRFQKAACNCGNCNEINILHENILKMLQDSQKLLQLSSVLGKLRKLFFFTLNSVQFACGFHRLVCLAPHSTSSCSSGVIRKVRRKCYDSWSAHLV